MTEKVKVGLRKKIENPVLGMGVTSGFDNKDPSRVYKKVVKGNNHAQDGVWYHESLGWRVEVYQGKDQSGAPRGVSPTYGGFRMQEGAPIEMMDCYLMSIPREEWDALQAASRKTVDELEKNIVKKHNIKDPTRGIGKHESTGVSFENETTAEEWEE